MSRRDELRRKWSKVALTDVGDQEPVVVQPGAYYVAIDLLGWIVGGYLVIMQFEDEMDAVQWLRFCVAPGMVANDVGEPLYDKDLDDVATDLLGEDHSSLRWARFGAFVEACDAVSEEAPRFDEAARSFNAAFEYQLEDEKRGLTNFARVESYGPLGDLLAGGYLRGRLGEGLEDEGERFEYSELACLVREGRFDERDERHLALAQEYLSCFPDDT